MLRLVVLSGVLASVLAEWEFINIAQGKNTSQSSVGWSGYAYKAVDGSTSGRYWDGTCTHCNNEGVMWWEVDLGQVYNIHHIEVYGRTDCCSNRIDGAKLWIGNNKCADLSDQGSEQMETVYCDDAADSVGRTVRIEVLDYLTLCEVKVFMGIEYQVSAAATQTPAEHRGEMIGNYTNVALNKETTQSSTYYNGYASRGVDGYTETAWNSKSCTYTRNNEMNYWEVDLGRVYNIHHINIYTRSDGDQSHLNGATVKIGANTCETLGDVSETHMATVNCNDDASKRVGRIVRVEQWATTVTICEVQVMVEPETLPEVDEVIATVDYTHLGESIDEYFNVAKDKNTSASSEPWSGYPARAVDGVTNQNWGMGSCSHTNAIDQEWWQVDLGRVYQIDHIRVWGRTDAHTDRLGGARLWIGSHRCGTLTAMGTATEPDVITCSEEESAGRYVTIEHFDQYITLCEVQVMVRQAQIDLEPNEMHSNGEIHGNYTNVALGKEAWQSTTGWNGYASRAVDGWVLTSWNSGSCTHTLYSEVSQWHVDLGKVYKIDHIKFWGRTDSNQDRLKWARVYVGRTQCGILSEEQYEEGQPWTISCSGAELGEVSGRIVTIERLSEYLTLCEVQVMVKNEDVAEEELPSTFPSYENVARGRPTNQSSIGWSGSSSRAVDGFSSDSSAMWNEQSCTHTLYESFNYWEVDLEDSYYIDYIEILGRKDCCGNRLDGAIITLDGKTVTGLTYTNDQLRWEIPMNYARGRRLRVALLNEYLTICEFSVWVDHNYDASSDTENQVDLSVDNIAFNKVATSSSVYLGGVASNANDGDTEGNFYSGSCMSTGAEQGSHWWSVDLGDSHTVGHVIVYPRLDEDYAGYIDGASVKVGDHVCGTIEHESHKAWYRVDCEGMAGTSVSVSKDAGYLQLCEVVVQVAED